MINKIKEYFWYGLTILGVSILFVIMFPYAIYKSFKHQDNSK